MEHLHPFDLRALGWSGSFAFRTHEKFGDWFDFCKAGHHRVTLHKVGRNQRVRKYVSEKLTGSNDYHDFVIDQETGMIIQMNGFHHDDVEKVESLTSDEIKTKWEERGEVYVPTQVSLEGYDYKRVRQDIRQ